MTDEELLTRYLETKDHELFTILHGRMQNDLYALALQMLHSHEDAEDVVQAAWFKLSRSKSRQIASARGFLKTAVKRLALDRQRDNRSGAREGMISLDAMIDRQRRQMSESDEWPDSGRLNSEPYANASQINMKESDEDVQRALDALPLNQREAVGLYHCRSLEIPEMVEMLGVKAATIRSRIRRGVGNLKGILAPDNRHKRSYRRPVRATKLSSQEVVCEFARVTDAIRAGYNQHSLQRAIRKGTPYRGLNWSYANAT